MAVLSVVRWLPGLQGCQSPMAVLSTVAYPRWLIPPQGVAEEQAPPDGSAGEMALPAAVISARVVAGSLTGVTGWPAAGPSAGGRGRDVDQAHDRVRRRRDDVDRQIWQRVHPGEADNELAAAGCQEPGVPALLVVVEIGVMVSESGSPGSAAAVFRWPG